MCIRDRAQAERDAAADVAGVRAHREGAVDAVQADGVEAAAYQQEDGVVEHAAQAQHDGAVDRAQGRLVVAGGGGQGEEGDAELVALALGGLFDHAFLHQALQLSLIHIFLFQDTSLVYVLSLTDFLGAASKIGQRDGRLVELYLFVAVVYFVICFTASRLVKRLEKRVRVLR